MFGCVLWCLIISYDTDVGHSLADRTRLEQQLTGNSFYSVYFICHSFMKELCAQRSSTSYTN
jgi:hypothetical protein